MKKIIVENLKYKYPTSEKLVLNDISFEVNQGDFIGVIGENSSGKSSLGQAIVGLIPHFHHGSYGGRVIVSGLNVRETEISELSSKVGIVFENPFTQITGSKLSVYEEVAFGLENLGIEREEMIRRIDYSLKLLDIYELRNKSPFQLSGGQMQRLAIASVIAMNPEIIVFDEPTSQLDPKGSEEVFKAIRDLSSEGMTIVMIENKIEKMAQYCHKIILIHDGKLIDYDSPRKIFSREDLNKYNVSPPTYTKICQRLNKGEGNLGLYPITLEETYNRLVSENE